MVLDFYKGCEMTYKEFIEKLLSSSPSITEKKLLYMLNSVIWQRDFYLRQLGDRDESVDVGFGIKQCNSNLDFIAEHPYK